MARAIIPAKLAASYRHLLRLAAAHPDLAEIYERRAAVFAERERTFDPKMAMRLAALRREEATELLDRLDRHLADARNVIVLPDYGPADVVWTVFLARMEFVGMEGEIASRSALASYWRTAKERPSFSGADIWTKLHVRRLVRGLPRLSHSGRGWGQSPTG